MFKKYELQPGHELRGFRVKLYPDRDTEFLLTEQQRNLRTVWNWLIKQSTDHNMAVQSYAVKHGLVPNKPLRPDFDGLASDESSAAREEYRSAMTEWYKNLKAATKNLDECKYRNIKDWLAYLEIKHEYQLFQKVLRWHHQDLGIKPAILPNAHIYQALGKNFFQKSARPKRYKKRYEDMPVQVRSGECFELGEFGKRGTNDKFYNCLVRICGLKIRGRLPGRKPGGRVLEGVTLTREADGWYASVKVEVPMRKLQDAVPGSVIGLDVGLDNIVAMSNGSVVANYRAGVFNNEIARLQKLSDTTTDPLYASDLANKIARLHQRARRHMMHKIYNEVVKPLEYTETIKIEQLNSRIGQMGSRKVSVMRLISKLLKERYGYRVREVECAYTSQDCSKCGKRSKETWSYDHGAIGLCPFCGHSEHRDINAARNIAAKPVISLDNITHS